MIILFLIWRSVFAWNGKYPESITYAITPIDQISQDISYFSFSKTSGAMKSMVPQYVLRFFFLFPYFVNLLMPKSMSLTCKLFKSFDCYESRPYIMILSIFKSLCTIPLKWRYLIACISCLKINWHSYSGILYLSLI